MSSSRGRIAARWVAIFAGYTVLTIAFVWPLPRHLASAFPHDAGDPAFTAWVLWWNAHAVPLSAQWWNAPMFWPAADVFALSEHMLGISLLATPLQWLGAPPIVAFNLAFVLSFPLTATGAHLLGYSVTHRHDAALLAGLVFGFSPYRTSQLPHLQMLWVFGMPLALAALHRYLDSGRRAWLVVFGGAWLVQALSNGYLMLFFPVLLGCWLLWFVWRRAADAAAIGIAFLVSSLLIAPLAIHYERVHTRLNLLRHANEIQQFSADLTGLFAASPDLILWHGLSRFSFAEGELFPGMLAMAIAIAGVAAATRRMPAGSGGDRFQVARRMCAGLSLAIAAVAVSPLVIGPWRIAAGSRTLVSIAGSAKPLTIAALVLAVAFAMTKWFRSAWERQSILAFYALACALMYILSFGPGPRAFGTQIFFRAPYEWLMMTVPGFSSIRVPARFAMLGVLCLATLTAVSFARLTGRASRRRRLTLATIAAIVIAAESWPRMTLADAAPPIAALRDATTPVIELPIGNTERDIAAVYRSIAHGRPMVNGYSGYVPPHYVDLTFALASGDATGLDAIAAGRALTVVVDRTWEFERWRSLVEHHPQHRFVADQGPWRIYEVTPAVSAAPPTGEALPIASVTANTGAPDVPRVLDGDLRTIWNSRQLQRGTEEIAIDLGQTREVAAVRMELGAYRYDFPRALSVECAPDDAPLDVCWSGPAAALALRGVLEDPVRAPLVIPIGRSARRIKLRQTAADSFNGWSIAELQIIGR